MLELLREIFTSDAGSIGLIFALFMLIFLSIYKIATFSTKIVVEHGAFGKRVDKIEKNTDDIKEEVMKVKAIITTKFSFPDPFLQAHSPVRLTQLGIDVAKELDIEKRISSNWENILALVDKNVTNKNAYDIQQFCIEQATFNLSTLISEKDVEDIKLLAFKKGRPIESFGGVIGVIIRDAYFKHKNIDVSDVDKHDPDKRDV